MRNPKHWQLPRAVLDENNKAALAEDSFYQWLNSYGWEVTNWDLYNGAAVYVWRDGDTRYDMHFSPFYLAGFGRYIYQNGIQYPAFPLYWSKTTSKNVTRSNALSYDGYWLEPAQSNNFRIFANSLRCLTQYICPKHWQLPRAKGERVITNPETGAWDWKPILDDKTFYKWLNSYGWTSYANNIFYGATKWQDGELTYLINLEPFYVPSNGTLIAGQYVAHSGFAWNYWSKSTLSPLPGGYNRAAFMGFVPNSHISTASTSTDFRNALSLRCLTQ